MLHALSWVRPEAFHQLRLLARIRNRFAHTHAALTFDDQTVRGYFASLAKHEERVSADFPNVVLSIRDTFLVRTAMTLFDLYADLSLMPASQRSGYGSYGGLSAGFNA